MSLQEVAGATTPDCTDKSLPFTQGRFYCFQQLCAFPGGRGESQSEFSSSLLTLQRKRCCGNRGFNLACKPHQSQSWEELGAGWHSYGFRPPGPQKPSLGLSVGMAGAHRWRKAREVVLGNHSMGTRGSLGMDAPEQLGFKPPNDSWSSFIHSSFIYWNTLRD